MTDNQETARSSQTDLVYGEIKNNWGWLLFSGIISVLLGIMIAARWPVSGLWVFGLFVAIEMIMHGWSYIFIAMAARSALETRITPTPDPAT